MLCLRKENKMSVMRRYQHTISLNEEEETKFKSIAKKGFTAVETFRKGLEIALKDKGQE